MLGTDLMYYDVNTLTKLFNHSSKLKIMGVLPNLSTISDCSVVYDKNHRIIHYYKCKQQL